MTQNSNHRQSFLHPPRAWDRSPSIQCRAHHTLQPPFPLSTGRRIFTTIDRFAGIASLSVHICKCRNSHSTSNPRSSYFRKLLRSAPAKTARPPLQPAAPCSLLLSASSSPSKASMVSASPHSCAGWPSTFNPSKWPSPSHASRGGAPALRRPGARPDPSTRRLIP